MIRVVCPNCQSKLNAKDELAGQTRKCPQCGAPVLIAPSETPEGSSSIESPDDGPHAEPRSEPVLGANLRLAEVPSRLDALSRYWICDQSKLVAAWKNDGQGWMLKTRAGMVSAKRNRDMLPNRGNFKLVELRLVETEQGHRLQGITSYQLATSWALTSLNLGDHAILSKVTGPGSLSKEQKAVLRLEIRDQLMHDVWKDAENVLQYLSDTDYHSPGTA